MNSFSYTFFMIEFLSASNQLYWFHTCSQWHGILVILVNLVTSYMIVILGYLMSYSHLNADFAHVWEQVLSFCGRSIINLKYRFLIGSYLNSCYFFNLVLFFILKCSISIFLPIRREQKNLIIIERHRYGHILTHETLVNTKNYVILVIQSLKIWVFLCMLFELRWRKRPYWLRLLGSWCRMKNVFVKISCKEHNFEDAEYR